MPKLTYDKYSSKLPMITNNLKPTKPKREKMKKITSNLIKSNPKQQSIANYFTSKISHSKSQKSIQNHKFLEDDFKYDSGSLDSKLETRKDTNIG